MKFPIVLRRLLPPGQPIELVGSIAPAKADSAEQLHCEVQSREEGTFQIYSVRLPDSVTIRPGDWRQFAYDHQKVLELVTQCVRDNLNMPVFEPWPWSSDAKAEVENCLPRALYDLSSVFDLKSVTCEFEDDLIVVQVEGEYKNGQSGVIIVRCDHETVGGPDVA